MRNMPCRYMPSRTPSALITALVLTAMLAVSLTAPLSITSAAGLVVPPPSMKASSAILVDASNGQALYSLNADQRVAPASITKIMTMLIVMEYVDAGRISLDDVVTVSADASRIGGSQVYLKHREQVSVRDLMAATAIRSANDAAYALAEYVAGTAWDFVSLMNQRAGELGMANTHFSNPEGLDDPDHYTTAADIAIMSRELVKHPQVLEWTSTWIGKMREGTYDLFNTNRLIKDYDGADGLKTGHTDTAGYCLSGTAVRGGTRLIAVVMGTATEDDRFRETAKLLDYGFRNFERYTAAAAGDVVGSTRIPSARKPTVEAVAEDDLAVLIPRGSSSDVTVNFEPTGEVIVAPIKKGQVLGRAVVRDASGDEFGSVNAVAQSDVPRANFIVRAWRSVVGFFGGLFRRAK